MKKRICLPLVLALVFVFGSMTLYAQGNVPSPTTEFYVGDFANLLSEETKEFIINTNLNYERTGEKPQVVVVTVPDMGNNYPESFTLELFDQWKIGNTDLDNGVLIFLALEERDIRIDVGYGLEGAIPDGITGSIIDRSLSHLSSGDYDSGLLQMFYDVTERINGEYGYSPDDIYTSDAPLPKGNTSSSDGFLFWGIVIFVIIIFIMGIFGGRRPPGSRRRRNLPRRSYTSRTNSYPFGGPFGTGSFGGGSSKGGGFGGGSFGGGGRTGGGGAGRKF